jgi:hypothetical protein
MWATKALLGMFHSQPKNTELAEYTVDRAVVEESIRTARLPKECGIYLNGRLGTRRVHHENEITVSTITFTLKEERRLIGLAIDIGGVSFDFLMDPCGVNVLRQGGAATLPPSWSDIRRKRTGAGHISLLVV